MGKRVSGVIIVINLNDLTSRVIVTSFPVRESECMKESLAYFDALWIKRWDLVKGMQTNTHTGFE